MPETISFEDDITRQDSIPEDHKLDQIASLAEQMVDLEDEVDNLSTKLAQKKLELAEISTKKLPEAMGTVDLEQFTLKGGYQIKVRPFISATMPRLDKPDQTERAEKAYAWLAEQDLEHIIKHFVSIQFTKGEEELAERAIGALKDAGFIPDDKLDVHHMTLKSVLKEIIAKGVPVPLSLFEAYIGEKATIKRPKDG